MKPVTRIARFVRKRHAAILGCLFGGVGADAPLVPSSGLGGGTRAPTGGKGGSATSLSVSTGSGASAGGKLPGVISSRRAPGLAGLMYGGVFSPKFKQWFSAIDRIKIKISKNHPDYVLKRFP